MGDMAAMARGLPTLRPTLITATVALTPDTAMAVLATAMAVLATDMASVLRTPMPTTAMAVMADTDLDTPLAMVMVDTATSDKSAKGWCRELQPIKICSISKLGIGNKPCSLKIRYFLMCIFMDKKTKCDKKMKNSNKYKDYYHQKKKKKKKKKKFFTTKKKKKKKKKKS